jgi:hypothetical protein
LLRQLFANLNQHLNFDPAFCRPEPSPTKLVAVTIPPLIVTPVPTLSVVAVATPTERPLAFKVFVLPAISYSVAVMIPVKLAPP